MKYYANYSANKLTKQIYNPVEEEKNILAFWTKQKIWDLVQEKHSKENHETFSILNGPPFPTGSPHSGHILNALMKDIYTRFWHQKNYQVISKFGWDCHGLAVEHEVDKKLEISEPQELYRIGVTKYNEECRKFVERHKSDWKTNLDRIGILVDKQNAYSTMNVETMEDIWGVFKQLFDKGLVYKGTYVLPYSTGCFSHLSHFEADQNCKKVNDVTAMVAFELEDSEDCLLVYTESPWKLAANFAICVKPKSTYTKIEMIDSKRRYIVSKYRLSFMFPNSDSFRILEEFQGKQICHMKYKPLFDYVAGSFTVIQDDSICAYQGTGIVALCPHFNQNEYRICLENGLSLDGVVCPVDSCGRFTRSIKEVAGLTVNEANLAVLQNLQQRNLLVYLQNVKREKPHCWRSDVPLIDKLASTWFLKVGGLKTKLKEHNSKVNWVPSSNKKVMESKFNKLTDWPIGRQRFWGTPLPIWSSPSGDEIRCIGSLKELLELTNVKDVCDIHKESIDRLVIPSEYPGSPPLRRVTDVLDCWFESAALAFTEKKKNNNKPANLMVEGEDQLSGWFLTTAIISAALSVSAPSIAIVAHGLVRGSDGTKLSKRKYNHNDAMKIAEKYGADCLRLYLASTPLVTGESMELVESEARKFKNKIFQPLYKILFDLMPCLGKQGWVSYGIVTETTYYKNVFDKWILFRAESLLQFYEGEMKAHRFNTVIPKVIEFLDEYYKWFIPAMRLTAKGNNRCESLPLNIVYKLCLVLAPYAPFFTEFIFQIFKPWTHVVYDKDSSQNMLIPEKANGLLDFEVELKITRWQKVIEMVWEARQKHTILLGYRIFKLFVVHPLADYLDEAEELNDVFQKLTNVHEVVRTSDRIQFGSSLKVTLKTDSKLYATLSRDELEKLSSALKNLENKQVEELIRVGSDDIADQHVSLNDVEISHIFEKQFDEDNKSIVVCRDDVFVVLKMNKSLEYFTEGSRKEMISSIQKFRKRAKVYPSEVVNICFLTEDSCLEAALEKYADELRKTTNSKIKSITEFGEDNEEEEVFQETVDIKGSPVILYLFKKEETKE